MLVIAIKFGPKGNMRRGSMKEIDDGRNPVDEELDLEEEDLEDDPDVQDVRWL